MEILVIVLFFVYFLIAQRVFKIWLKVFQADTSISPEERGLSWIVLVLGTIFWPIVVPSSYMTLLEKKLENQEGM